MLMVGEDLDVYGTAHAALAVSVLFLLGVALCWVLPEDDLFTFSTRENIFMVRDFSFDFGLMERFSRAL